ncbi:MAG TPA: alpha/beta hydrolase [Nitrososphaerales archaeon]|nr:alpha/beta hydrolase [Nitrososphaerales archaeon]
MTRQWLYTVRNKLQVVRKGYADTPKGQIHYMEAGQGQPLLLLHQTPRSTDEFAEVVPILAKAGFRAIAMDTVGFGESYRLNGNHSIETYARGVVDFLDAMKLQSIFLVGHHTGAVIAVEVAVMQPQRIKKLVLSACPYYDSARRAEASKHPVMDGDEESEDGSYLVKLWQRRQGFYPKGRIDLLRRFMGDALLAGEGRVLGHQAVRDYPIDEKYGRIQCPTLLVCATEDPFSFPVQSKVSSKIPNSKLVPIPGGTVAAADQMPEEFAHSFISFLS